MFDFVAVCLGCSVILFLLCFSMFSRFMFVVVISEFVLVVISVLGVLWSDLNFGFLAVMIVSACLICCILGWTVFSFREFSSSSTKI